MFIVSKRNYLVIRADGSAYRIKKDYIGEIPEDVAESVLVQRAIQGGNIAVPGGTKDRALYQADEAAEKLAAKHDIRPDAEKPELDPEAEAEDTKKSARNKKRE